MSWYRSRTQARLEEGMTEGLVGGGRLQLVTVRLSDDGVGESSDDAGSAGRARAAGGLVSAPERGANARVRASAARRAAERRFGEWR